MGTHVQLDGVRKMSQMRQNHLSSALEHPVDESLRHLPDCRELVAACHRDVNNHAGTATASPPRFSAESEPCAPVVHNNGHGKHDLHNRDIDHLVEDKLGNHHGLPDGGTMGFNLCVTTGMSTTLKNTPHNCLSESYRP